MERKREEQTFGQEIQESTNDPTRDGRISTEVSHTGERKEGK